MKSDAVRRINAKGLRQGPIWQKGYMDRAIRREEDLVRVARYIVANPLRAGSWRVSGIIRYGIRYGWMIGAVLNQA